MNTEELRGSLKKYFENSFLKSALHIGGELAIVFASIDLVSSIIRPISWMSFGGATYLLLIISFILAFANSDFQKLFIALCIKFLDIVIYVIKTFFVDRYYSLSTTMGLIGNIVIIVIYLYLIINVIKYLKSTGEWQKNVSGVRTQINQGIEKVQDTVKNVQESAKNAKMNYEKSINANTNTDASANVNATNSVGAGTTNASAENISSEKIPSNDNTVNNNFSNTVVYKGKTYYNTPISVLGYILYSILFGFPIIGFIMIIVFSIIADNINVKNYAKSFLCVWVIILILIVLASIMTSVGVSSFR